MFVLPFIFITDPPAGIYIRAKLFYAFLLLLFADMAEKFYNQITIVCQLTFKTSDTVNFHLVLFFIQLSVQNAFCNLVHPAWIQKCKFTSLRYLLKVPAQKRFSFFFLCRNCHGCYLEETGINICDQFPDQAALSCRSPAFHQNKYGCLMFF